MKSILKQTSWLFLAQASSRVIGFFYTIFLARNLGVADFGLYSAALAFFSLASSVADFGFNRFLIREVARDHQKIPLLLCNIALLRLTVAAVIFSFFAIGLNFLDPDKLRVSLILLAILAVLPQAVSLTLDAIFVALQKLQYSSLALLVLSVASTIFGVVFIGRGFGVVGVVIALILGQLVYLTILTFLLRVQRVRILSNITTKTIKQAILGSLPYGLLGILGLLYFRVDLLFLTYLSGNFEAGIYGAAYRFLEAVVFIPSSLATALFPTFAKLHQTDKYQIRKLYFKSLKILFPLSIMLVLVYIFLLPLVIITLLPNYLSSIKAIRILSLAIPFMFCHFPAVQVLLSTDKYLKITLYLAFLMLSFNIILNLIFIPQYGFVAASWVTVASEALSFLIFFSLLMKNILKKSL